MANVQTTDSEEQVVVFELGGECYGVDIGLVQEIIRPPAITAVPRAPEYVEGVINLRGRVIPVINLRTRFGLPGTERNRASRIVVLSVEGQTVGAAVDAVSEVLRIPLTSVEPPGATLAGAAATRLRGIAKLEDRLIILLEPKSILSDAEGIESVAA